MTNGLIRPKGSNIFADTFKSDHFVKGSFLAYCINLEKQNRNSSVGLFHIIPSLDKLYSVQHLLSPIKLLSGEAPWDGPLTMVGCLMIQLV